MKKNNLKRYLASLLAVLMLISVTGISPAVFADWVTPPSLTNSGISLAAAKSGENVTLKGSSFDIRIPYNTDGTINFDTLYQRIFDTCVDTSMSTPKTRDQVEIKYYVAWVYAPLEGWGAYSAIKEGETHKVKFTYHYGRKSVDATCNITFLGREELPGVSAITADATFNDDLSINYDALRQDIFDQVKAQVNLPENVKFENVSFTYKYHYGIDYWPEFDGTINVIGIDFSAPAVEVGKTYVVKMSWGGDDTYKAWSPEFDVTVVDGRTDTSISFVDDCTVNIPFTEAGIDYEAVKESIWALVDTITPEDISKDSITVKYDGTNINDNPAISEGNHTLNFSYAGSATYKPFSTDVPVNFVDNRIVAFAAKERPENLSRGYVGNTLDEAKTLEKAREELVTALKDVPLSEIKVEYKFAGNYIPLNIDGIRLHVTNINKTDIRVSYAGNATYKAFTAEFKDLYFADNRVPSSIAIKADASITYNMDAKNMKEQIFNNVIDWESENTKLPEGITVDDLTFECKSYSTWKDIAGSEYPNLDAGDAQKIRISFGGDSDYKSGEFEFTIKVEKATVNVSMNKFSTAYAGVEEDLTREALGVTLDPNDTRIDVYMIFAGINTNLNTSVNLVLTDEQWAAIQTISKVQKFIYKVLGYEDKLTLEEQLKDGITIGEFKKYVNEFITALEKASENETVNKYLEEYGISISSLKAMASIFDKLTQFSDDTTIAFGVPQHAGLYRAYAVAVHKNYNTSYASGTVLILMNWKNMKIVPNEELKKQTITTAEAEEYADGSKAAATLKCGDTAVNDQSSLHYRYTGLNTIYSSHDFPTKAGKYIVTVSVRGGDYYALPTTFTFTVK